MYSCIIDDLLHSTHYKNTVYLRHIYFVLWITFDTNIHIHIV